MTGRTRLLLRELRAVRLLLHRHFADYVSDPRVRRLLLHEDNQAVVYVLNAMVSASKEMMIELRKLEVLLKVLGARLEARWIPSAVNRFADTLSRTWDPRDARATDSLLHSIQNEYRLPRGISRTAAGDTLIARKKYLLTQMDEDWGDGKSRLLNPPFDLLPVFVRKIAAEDEERVLVAPRWPTKAWYERLQSLNSRMAELNPGDDRPLLEGEGKNEGWSAVVTEIA